MPEPGTTEAVISEIHIDASPETVFGFFTEPEKLTRWLCSEATSDPRPGGVIRQTHPGGADNPGGPWFMEGEFVEVDHPNRVVFTWGFRDEAMDIGPGESTVEVVLTAAGGGTDLVLTHTGLPTRDSRKSHSEGWAFHLKNLAGLDLRPA